MISVSLHYNLQVAMCVSPGFMFNKSTIERGTVFLLPKDALALDRDRPWFSLWTDEHLPFSF